MSVFKGSNYVGSTKPGFGGFHKDSAQPRGGWASGFGSDRSPVKKESSGSGKLLGKKWKSSCKGCGGKL